MTPFFDEQALLKGLTEEWSLAMSDIGKFYGVLRRSRRVLFRLRDVNFSDCQKYIKKLVQACVHLVGGQVYNMLFEYYCRRVFTIAV